MRINKDKVQNLLVERGWNYGNLAKKSGINYNTLRRYIAQNCVVPYKKIQQIADVLDCDYLEITEFNNY